MTRVVEVDVYSAAIQTRKPMAVAFATIGQGRRAFIRLATDDGLVGWGETGMLLPEYSGETIGTAMVHAETLAPLVLGRSPFESSNLMEEFDRRLLRNEQTKSAFDIAMHDLMAQSAKVPLHMLFGGATIDRVRTQLNLSIGSQADLEADARRALDLGVKAVGLKAGKPTSPGVAHDVESVRIIREVAGPDVELWVDFNGGYSRPEAIQAIKGMERHGISQAEQPVPGWDIEGMAAVARNTNTPIVADESLWSHRDALRLAQLGAADILHHKLPKCSGLTGSRKVVAVAEAAGLPVVMGSMGMTNFGQAVLVHFVAAHPWCQLYPSKLRAGKLTYLEDVVANTMDVVDGDFVVPGAIGVGVEIDEEKLQAQSLSHAHFE